MEIGFLRTVKPSSLQLKNVNDTKNDNKSIKKKTKIKVTTKIGLVQEATSLGPTTRVAY